ncbi:hypothetical protein BS47DRAFT_1294509, partial [Hydnum rufescens UP504]
IGEAIKWHSTTIQTAIKRYNTLCLSTNPPWLKLTFKDVVEDGFLSNFVVL